MDPMSGIAENDPESIDALDAAFSKMAQDKGVTDEIPGLKITPKEDDDKAAADKAAADKVAADKAAAEKPAAEKPVVDDKAAADKVAADKAAAEKATADKAAADKAAADLYPEVQLPANSRGASAQAFATVKARAAADLTERNNKITELQAELTKHQEQLKGVVPGKDVEALKAENEAFRKWKAALDIDADPAIKAPFDTRLAGVSEFIYSRLKASGKVTDAHIEQIKKLGGPEAVEWSPIFEKLGDPQLQRLIQSKLDEAETVKFEREQAVGKAKANVDDYLAKRAEEFKGATGQHNEATKQVLTSLLTQVPWIVPPQVKADATEEQKKSATEQKAFIDDVNKTLSESLADDSPEMRAVLLMGVAQHLNLKRVHAAVVAEKDGLTKKLADSEKALADANAAMDKLKKGSVTRLRESSAPVDNKGLPAPKTDQLATASDALEVFRASRAV